MQLFRLTLHNSLFYVSQEHRLKIISVIFNTRSAKNKAAVRLETWNGVLGTTGKSNDCSYLQRKRVPST